MVMNHPSRPNRFTRPALAAVTLTAAALSLTACGSSGGASGSGEPAATGTATGTVTVTDATGTAVKVPEHPRRVLTLSEMDLDSALALGVKPVGLTAGRGQQGAPAYLAEQAAGIPVVGAVTGPDIEKVVRARPDVILAGQTADEQVLQQLRRIAPTVVTLDGSKNWKTSLQLTGKALGRTNEAKAFLADYDGKTAALKKDLGSRAGASVSVARYSAKGTAVMQQGVFISDVLKDLGFKRPGIQNDKGEGHSTPISDENLSEIDGDWLFIGTLASGGKDAGLLDQLAEKPAYRQLKAVRSGQAVQIDGSMWTSLGGAQAALKVLGDIREAMVK
ncbi:MULTISPECIES: iron-siderophore ABC transporter substrate-binding protein [unclassified Streptomyces]|uniref:ABC transporter substrate-binding protein n=1 Tax=unclassified Streptomyces TaxID=2593676 RepID=UPI001F04EA3F|nr:MULTISPECIES: iron-siderophore ABC transporter substrate-binding protein [unclassified Streptomyces]MCH0561764.1 iron-siderophore ABC transporter substrate-binding protein [Streptomyces sp. MUM 2J]MCH0571626.1 iron-siderophore ABC transporter substrate-binding protein [Streptomyces sp. MUM 136J]